MIAQMYALRKDRSTFSQMFSFQLVPPVLVGLGSVEVLLSLFILVDDMDHFNRIG